MEEACHELDLAAAESAGSLDNQDGGGVSRSFDQYSSALHRLFLLREEREKQTQVVAVLDQLSTFVTLTLPEGNPTIETVRKEDRVQRKKLQDMVKL